MSTFLGRHIADSGAAKPLAPQVDPAADAELMRCIAAGSTEALDTLVTRYWPRLVRYVARVLPHDDAAEDVAQRTFVRVWEKRADWRPTGSVSAYIYFIARNLALNERRRRATRTEMAGTVRIREERRRSPTPLDETEASELRTAVERAIDALPARRREVFRLSRFDGLSYSEIAEVMDISPQTVANQMTAALDYLRSALAPWIEPSPEPRTRSV